MKVSEKKLELQQEDIDILKAIIAEWQGNFRTYGVIAGQMEGIHGSNLVAAAGAGYYECAKRLSAEIKRWEDSSLTKVSETQK